MKDLSKRTITAIVFAVVLIGLIGFSFETFLLLLLIIVSGGLLELMNVFKKAHFPVHSTSLWIKFFLSSLLILYPCFDSRFTNVQFNYLVLIILSVVLFIEFLFQTNFSKSIAEFFLLLYLLVFLMSALDVYYFSLHRQYHYAYPLSIILMIWANDTFAYFIGSWLGKNKLMPDVSPQKSVEGFVGGIVFTITTALLVYYYLLPDASFWTIYDVVIIAIIVGVFGTMGDLVESKLKRLANVKDSGNLLPGHGGILDRFDAWFLSIPMIDIYFHLKMWIV
jgi:phosphatidate cytidylyltransferase